MSYLDNRAFPINGLLDACGTRDRFDEGQATATLDSISDIYLSKMAERIEKHVTLKILELEQRLKASTSIDFENIHHRIHDLENAVSELSSRPIFRKSNSQNGDLQGHHQDDVKRSYQESGAVYKKNDLESEPAVASQKELPVRGVSNRSFRSDAREESSNPLQLVTARSVVFRTTTDQSNGHEKGIFFVRRAVHRETASSMHQEQRIHTDLESHQKDTSTIVDTEKLGVDSIYLSTTKKEANKGSVNFSTRRHQESGGPNITKVTNDNPSLRIPPSAHVESKEANKYRFSSIAVLKNRRIQSYGEKLLTAQGCAIYRKQDVARKIPNCFAISCGQKFCVRHKGLLGDIFGISDPDILLGHIGSSVIHPSSRFGMGLEVTSCLLLIYCLCVVPVELSFWKDIGPCQKVPCLEMDMVADLFFLIEIVFRFFIGVEINGRYYDDLGTIAWTYATALSGLWFDVFTSIPLSWVDWSILQECGPEDPHQAQGQVQDAKSMRIVKTLRILKFIRLLKIFKIFSILSERLDISPSRLRMLKLFFVLFSAMHLFACFFWRVKSDTESDDQIQAWLEIRGMTKDDTSSVYMLCFYFVCTVFTTVGFGDVYPETFGERVFCIFLMSTAACVFGLILGELQEMYSTNSTRRREMEDHLESVTGFLQENSVPRETELRVKKWIRFQYPLQRRDDQSQTIMNSLPLELRQEFAGIINRGLFSKMFFWSLISNARKTKDNFVSQLVLRMRSEYFPAGSCIASHRKAADGIMLIVSGAVKIVLPGTIPDVKPHQLGHLITIGPGGSMGDNTILGDTRWGGLFGIEADFIAEEDCKLCHIYAEDLLEIAHSAQEYAPIRRLIERLAYSPCIETESLYAVTSPGGQQATIGSWKNSLGHSTRRSLCSLTGDDSCWESQVIKEMQAASADFHWIRLARLLLHCEL